MAMLLTVRWQQYSGGMVVIKHCLRYVNGSGDGGDSVVESSAV